MTTALPGSLRFSANRTVILTGSAGWEAGIVQEPAPLYAGGVWHLYYTGGWSSAAIGYASASTPTGPYTKSGSAVIGNGAGGMANPTAHFSAYTESSTIYIYYPDNINGGNLKVATAAVGTPTAFTTQGTALAVTAGATGIVNTSLYKRGTGDYVLMFESTAPSGPAWQTGYATGASPLGPFTVQSFPLSSLQKGDSTAMYGGPFLERQGSTWVLFYHASPTSTLPCDIYRATSADLVNWTPEPAPLIRRFRPQEYDQSADYAMVNDGAGGPWYAFWDGLDNVTPASVILMSVPHDKDRAQSTPGW